MPLNLPDGNMYKFITHTWNPVKGKCEHKCPYCYMCKEGRQIQTPIRLDTTEFRTDLKTNKFIFVGSGTDLFADNIPREWILRTLDYCYSFNNGLFDYSNNYLFQSKNPKRMIEFLEHPIFNESVACTTIETNRFYPEYMGNAPNVKERALAMQEISSRGIKTYVTIEPIMNFDLEEMIELIRMCNPIQVNIGANTNHGINLPEPSTDKILILIDELSKFTEVEKKSNLYRLL